MRSDAHRNLTALLAAAKEVFATDGVEAPAKRITDRAGVGVGTLYRHFPRRADLITAVLQHEIDACVAAAEELSATLDPWDAVVAWVDRYSSLVATKQGLAAALHSGDPAYEGLPQRLVAQLEPALQGLLDNAGVNEGVDHGAGEGADESAGGGAGEVVTAREVITTISLLWHPVAGQPPAFNERMVRVFIAGLRRTGR